ncbi:hypothetical protein M427DRAFT_382421 [Gonapodya prolifera JEL478]|uniref:Uncharacterized protein n=1 Tax=Gonapodya prolifera (strain JEL478) TaxID=1344416 RepID=A0A139AA98_GONPJ|nr:hypothetical protein M427DRAFT_382421 [Gonapodya prolifera JEL478]|eukprot:KXS13293.1 hypothetical protein M427DRAFT_382421 [Gonapodya prolifera JEL478]
MVSPAMSLKMRNARSSMSFVVGGKRTHLPPSNSAFQGKRVSAGMEAMTGADSMPFFVRHIVQHGLARVPQSGRLGIAKKIAKAKVRGFNGTPAGGIDSRISPGASNVASTQNQDEIGSLVGSGFRNITKRSEIGHPASYLASDHEAEPELTRGHTLDVDRQVHPAMVNGDITATGNGGSLADSVPRIGTVVQEDLSIHPSTPPVDTSVKDSPPITSFIPANTPHVVSAAKFGADLESQMLVGPNPLLDGQVDPMVGGDAFGIPSDGLHSDLPLRDYELSGGFGTQPYSTNRQSACLDDSIAADVTPRGLSNVDADSDGSGRAVSTGSPVVPTFGAELHDPDTGVNFVEGLLNFDV